jgi:hypothetical protein
MNKKQLKKVTPLDRATSKPSLTSFATPPATQPLSATSSAAQPISPPLNSNRLIRPDGLPFWQFLTNHNIEYSKADFPFLTRHQKPQIKPVFDFVKYSKIISRGEALAYLYTGFGRALNYVGPVLDRELEHGFNDHTDRHTLWVSQTGVELLQRSGLSANGEGSFDATTEVMMTLVGMTHDLGNFLSRKEHSTYSAWLLTHLFANWKKTPALRRKFRQALYAILFHEEPVLVELGLPLQSGNPLQWALVAADKMHVGRDRLGGRSFESGIKKGAFEDDIHILLNALIVRSSWSLGVKSFIWNLDFSVDQLEKKFSVFTKGNNRLWLPKIFQRMFLSQGIIYRESFARQFREIYHARMEMAAECVFLLFPYVDRFVVQLTDNDTRRKVGSGMLEVWEKRRG